ncbi:hypothetical protein JTB14_001467 [Gonioctena quinquepunctata]|nr:hypothetical protein JTB14_001467 [Gonioctena quinquepunctata]
MPRKKWNQFSFDKQLNSKSDDYDGRQSENSPDRQLKAYEIKNSEESKFFSTFDYMHIMAVVLHWKDFPNKNPTLLRLETSEE